MKRLLFTIILAAITPIMIMGLTAQNQLTASNAEFYTPANTPIKGDLNKVITDGIVPYNFQVQGQAINGTVFIAPIGSFTFTLEPQAKTGSFEYAVTDAIGATDDGTVTIVVE